MNVYICIRKPFMKPELRIHCDVEFYRFPIRWRKHSKSVDLSVAGYTQYLWFELRLNYKSRLKEIAETYEQRHKYVQGWTKIKNSVQIQTLLVSVQHKSTFFRELVICVQIFPWSGESIVDVCIWKHSGFRLRSLVKALFRLLLSRSKWLRLGRLLLMIRSNKQELRRVWFVVSIFPPCFGALQTTIC